MSLSAGEMIEVRVGRVVDLDEGNETAAVTAAAMVDDAEEDGQRETKR